MYGRGKAMSGAALAMKTLAAASLLLVACVATPAAGPLPLPPAVLRSMLPDGKADTYPQQLEALALLQSLNVELLTNDSATLTLERWCATRGLADPARVTAERDRAADQRPTDAQRALLGVGPAEPVGYRRVKLRCGSHVLSEADNWYVPGRLAAAMNEVLDTSDVPFGRAVQSLGFSRQRLDAQLLWTPSPAVTVPIPPRLLRHTALLKLPDGRPISLVDETYTSAVLAAGMTRPDDAPATVSDAGAARDAPSRR